MQNDKKVLIKILKFKLTTFYRFFRFFWLKKYKFSKFLQFSTLKNTVTNFYFFLNKEGSKSATYIFILFIYEFYIFLIKINQNMQWLISFFFKRHIILFITFFIYLFLQKNLNNWLQKVIQMFSFFFFYSN